MSELKPCPFCGGKAVNEQDNHPIYCGSCYSSMPYGVCENDMITLWNTRVDKWVSVDDRLPTVNERVLAFDSGGFGVLSARYSTRGWYLEGKLDNFQNVTHWMPLPAPPVK